jgi:threonine/homoserine/homoserine lactone efflux protein
MNLVSIFFISFAIGLSGALTPGPLLAAVIHKSTEHGLKSALFISLGHALLEALMLLLIIFGLSRFFNGPGVIFAIRLLGSAVMILFGLNIIKDSRSPLPPKKSKHPSTSKFVRMGIGLSASNPYWTIWWVTIGLGLVLSAKQMGMIAVCIFFIGHITADFACYGLVGTLIAKNKRFINKKAHKIINIICALVLIGFGIYFLSQIFIEI